jgi:fission process protein 1
MQMDAPHNREAYREGPVRLLGYANELGESFRPLVPRPVVLSSYAVASAYVVTDAEWRSRQPPPGRSRAVEALDTVRTPTARVPMAVCSHPASAGPCIAQLLWQGLASVAVPGVLINRIVWAAGKLPLLPRTRAWLPTVTGLACIPFIVKPVDDATDVFMDTLIRPQYSPKAP